MSIVRLRRPLVSAIVRRVRADGGRVALACRSVGQLGEKGNAIPPRLCGGSLWPRGLGTKVQDEARQTPVPHSHSKALSKVLPLKADEQTFCLSLSSVQDHVCLDM